MRLIPLGNALYLAQTYSSFHRSIDQARSVPFPWDGALDSRTWKRRTKCFCKFRAGTKSGKQFRINPRRNRSGLCNPQRQSRLIYTVFNSRITVLSGKHTARLEVDQTKSSSGEIVPVTSLERTLIDVAVRPAYAGGVSSVLRAFELARKRISTQKPRAFSKSLIIDTPTIKQSASTSKWQAIRKRSKICSRRQVSI